MQQVIFHRDQGFKAFVYRNLQRDCWSVKALSGPNKGRVVLHATEVLVTDAEFRVNEAGRQRVLREKRKNVHAGVVGYVYHAHVIEERYDTSPTVSVEVDEAPDAGYYSRSAAHREVTYNPYKFDKFVYADTLDAAEVTPDDETVVLAANSRVYLQSFLGLLRAAGEALRKAA